MLSHFPGFAFPAFASTRVEMVSSVNTSQGPLARHSARQSSQGVGAALPPTPTRVRPPSSAKFMGCARRAPLYRFSRGLCEFSHPWLELLICPPDVTAPRGMNESTSFQGHGAEKTSYFRGYNSPLPNRERPRGLTSHPCPPSSPSSCFPSYRMILRSFSAVLGPPPPGQA